MLEMKRNDFILAGLLGVAYIGLITVLVGITATWGGPISSDDSWGGSAAAAVTYMQAYHSIGVVLAALPIAIIVARRYEAGWIPPTAIIAAIGSGYMLFDQLRGAWLLSQHDLAFESLHLVSGAIDIVKTGLIPFIVTAIVARAVASRSSQKP